MPSNLKFDIEWKMPVPWGEIALRRCGKPDGDPVLLIHGRQDSSSVFEPILEYLPEKYLYVALDMPGNGLSTPLPRGPKLTRLHFLSAMELVVQYLGWKKFMFIGHSMGCEQGLFYNTVYPGRITRMVLFDGLPTLMRMQITDPAEFQRTYYDDYYMHFARDNFMRKCRSRTQSLTALQRLRQLSEASAAKLLERNFHPEPPKDEETLRRQKAQREEQSRRYNEKMDAIFARINHLRETDPDGSLEERMALLLGDPGFYERNLFGNFRL
ncbi:unnamed protein product [Chrysodeixis includens]|uniref:AB hydrolase-1 domain-containing protein n=1 Tax=Chrysodeixis includens TaxID=689277 RepID=A0A9P0BY03_CHRIL|nr:unnamed protein product [Chrysodeixis includens]